MKIDDITVVIPSQDRPERLLRAIESVLASAPGVEVVCVIDRGDEPTWDILGGLDVTIVPVDGALTTAERWNAGGKWASGNLLVTGADDLVFQPGWAEAALADLVAMNGYGVVALNPGPDFSFGQLASHFMTSRKYLAIYQGGVLMPPVYQHGFCDVEVTHRATSRGMIKYSEGARVTHEHPFNGTAEDDPIYQRGAASNEADDRLFLERKEAGFPNDWAPVIDWSPDGWGRVCVVSRSYKFPEIGFVDSWTGLAMAGLRKGDVIYPLKTATALPTHVAANHLVAKFLTTKCDSILFIDDDMEFGADTLSVLRDNKENFNYDVVMGFCTFKTEPPHAVVYRKDEVQPEMPEALGGVRYNALAYVPDNSVVTVDAVGMAFTLIKRHVFEAMIGEYGPEWTVWFDWGKHSEGEDVRFSQRCQDAGFKLGVDTNAKIRHIGRRSYGWIEHQQLIKQMENNYG